MLQCPVSPTDNLLELGLNSILATQFVWQAAQFGIAASSEKIINFPTIQRLVAELAQGEQEEAEVLEEVLVVEGADGIPLSDAERSLYPQLSLFLPVSSFSISFDCIRYFLQALDSNSHAYNESFMVHFNGRLDIATLKASLLLVAERQPSIRAQFFLNPQSGLPHKRFNSSLDCDIALHTSAPDVTALEMRAMDLTKAQTCSPFNLESGPLVRVLVVQGCLHPFSL